ncbi:MAG: ion channel [Candidatus Absconditabacteria bacterium]
MSKNSQGKKFFSNLLIIEVGAIILFIVLGATIFAFVEHHSFFDSLYFTITTMATVGFGDITPHTVWGKGLVMLYALTGVPLFVSLSGIILENRFNRTVKHHVTKFYKEIQEAEREIKDMEEKVSDEISDVMAETEINEEKIDDTQRDVRKTQKDVIKTEQEVEKIEKVLENELEEDHHPRWKKIIKK